MTSTNETGPGLEPTLYTPPPGVTVGKFKNHPAYKPARSYMEEVAAALTPGHITDLILECHGAAWHAGWWHDPRTNEPLKRNNAEMLMLMVSELCEAADGDERGLWDDKLKGRRMMEVELADFEIRLFDFCGGLRLDLQAAYTRSEAEEPVYTHVHPIPTTPGLWRATRHVVEAMEADRKGNRDGVIMSLARALRMVRWMAGVRGFNVPQARVEKMAYNASRPDHKREARLAPGGKAY